MKKIFGILSALVLVASLGLVTAAPVLADPLGTIRHVPSVYRTIQDAIDASGPGDAIMVAAGNYSAFQVIEKTNIRIIGAAGTTVNTAAFFATNGTPIHNPWVMAAVYRSANITIEGINFDGIGVTGKNVTVGIAYVDSTGKIADLTVKNMSGNSSGVGVAIIGYASSSAVEMKGAAISNNHIGVFASGNSALQARFNKIVGNSYFGAWNYGGGTLNATYNWWGHASGPYHPIATPSGTGDAVSDNVDFNPWLEGIVQTVTDGIVNAKTTANTEVVVNGTATVTVFRYGVNPGGNPPTGIQALGKWVDVYVPDTSQVTQIEIRLYYTAAEVAGIDESSLRLRYWNGTTWMLCSDRGVNTTDAGGYSGYMWAKIRANTSPSLADLRGEEFGGYHPEYPPTGGCFIATAAYGTDAAKQLDLLREFRDTVLLPNSLGARFLSLYYRTSPPIANSIARHDLLRTAVRVGFVDPIVRILTWTHDLWSARDS